MFETRELKIPQVFIDAIIGWLEADAALKRQQILSSIEADKLGREALRVKSGRIPRTSGEDTNP